MHAFVMEGLNATALLVRQRTHLSASSSSRESGLRNTFGSRPKRASARTCSQKHEQQADNGNERIKQKFEKYPDGPTRMDTPIEAYRRDVIPGRVYESLSLDSEDEIRGYACCVYSCQLLLLSWLVCRVSPCNCGLVFARLTKL